MFIEHAQYECGRCVFNLVYALCRIDDLPLAVTVRELQHEPRLSQGG